MRIRRNVLLLVLSLFCTMCFWSVSSVAGTNMLVNYGINGSWYDPATSGQGFVFDLIPSRNLLAAYWFTYPADGGAREWYLGVGDISGNSVEFTIYQTENGVFDQISAVETNAVGSANLKLSSCGEATWNYTIDTQGLGGEIVLQRLAPDYFCELFLAKANTSVVSHSNAWVNISGEWKFEGCVNLENSDSHGNERFTFTETKLLLEIERYSQPGCQGALSLQTMSLDIQRVDKTIAMLEGAEVIANRFIMTDADSGQEIRQLIYVDDRGSEQRLGHGILDSQPDSDGYPTEIPSLYFYRVKEIH